MVWEPRRSSAREARRKHEVPTAGASLAWAGRTGDCSMFLRFLGKSLGAEEVLVLEGPH